MIAGISSVIWLFVIGMILLTTVRRAKRISGNTARNSSFVSADRLYAAKKPSTRNIKSPIRSNSRNVGDGMILKDDKNNDWLALQLREEAKAKVRMSDMFQLKADHLNKCDAEFIKRFHESNCDADGIDTGTKKRAK